ncbi:hypothetical protein LCM21_13915 [Ruegeria profundi]|nr:glycosyltransferase [Ruegeria profundi]MCA0929498.1 hypothetical protein [Ruegeria profundi]
MQVVYGVDGNLLFPALVSAYSAIQNASKAIDVTIFGQDFTSDDIALVEKVNSTLARGTVSYRAYDLAKLNRFPDFKTKFPAITLLPLFLPELCDQRCVFIDADTLVLSDVCELLEQDLDGHALGACVDMGLVTMGEGRFLRPNLQQMLRPAREYEKSLTRVIKSIRLGFIPGENYFNAGIMVMDCPAIRNSADLSDLDDFDRLIPHIHDLPEQDRLNEIFFGKWSRLPMQWNTRPQIWFDTVSPKYRKMTDLFRAQLAEARDNPKMWHYVGGKKPWKATALTRLLCRRAYRDYRDYVARFENDTGLTFSM